MTPFSCGCKVSRHLKLYCPEHIDWMCHGGATDHTEKAKAQPNFGACPICALAMRRGVHKSVDSVDKET